jgi:hypothetical protein
MIFRDGRPQTTGSMGECRQLMTSSEPSETSLEVALSDLTDSASEVYVIHKSSGVAGSSS